MLHPPSEFLEKLRQALGVDLPISPPGPWPALPAARPASVLVLFAGNPSDPSVLLTRRTEHVEKHKGQIALPGGVRDPEDPSEVATALRETEEEVGLPRDRIRVLGNLPSFPTFTGFEVTPVIGLLDPWEERIETLPVTRSPEEIAEIFWARLSELNDPAIYRPELLNRGGIEVLTHSYQVGAHRIWGITGLIVKNLLDRLASVRLE